MASSIGMFIVKFVAAYAISKLLAPKQPDIEGPRLDSLVVQESAYGKDVPKVYGSARLAGNVIWSAGLVEHEHKEDTGKGGGGGSYTTYTYTCSFAVGICEGPIVGIRRIWADSKLIWDGNDGAGDITDDPFKLYLRQMKARGSGKVGGPEEYVFDVSLHYGDMNQEPDSIIEAEEGVGNVPAYRGIAYIVFEEMNLSKFGNRIPNLEIEVVTDSSNEYVYALSPGRSTELKYLRQSGYFYRNHGSAADNHNSIYDSDFNLLTTYTIPDWDGWSSTCVVDDNTLLAFHDGGNTWSWLDIMSGSIIKQLDTGGSYRFPIDASTVGHVDVYGEILVIVSAYDFIVYNYNLLEVLPNNALIPEPVVRLTPDFGSATSVLIYDGELYAYCKWSSGAKLFKVNLSTGESTEVGDFWGAPSTPGRQAPGEYCENISITDYGDLIVNWERDVWVFDGISDVVKSVNIFTSSNVMVQSVVDDLLATAGLVPVEYDTTELATDEIIGYIRASTMTAASALQPLMQLYQFDLAEIDWQIKAKKRGRDAEVDIAWNELAAHAYGTDPPSPLPETLTPEAELPIELSVKYSDYDLDYQPNVEYARRSSDVVSTIHKENLEFPVIMGATQALQAAEVLFNVAWVQRQRYKAQLPADYMYLAPGDVITVDDSAYRLLIDSITVNFPNMLTLECFAEEPGAYSSDSVAQTPYIEPQPVPGATPAIQAVFLNLPSLQDPMTKAGVFVAGYSMTGEWPGAQVWVSYDDGYTWFMAGYIEQMSTMGRVTDVLTTVLDVDSASSIIDEGDEINVEILSYGRSLEGVSQGNLFSGSNTAAVAANASWAAGKSLWEIIGFQDAAEQADGTFNLTNIIRGRCGTDYSDLDSDNAPESLVACHAANDQFVLLEEDRLVFIPIPEEYWETEVQFKVLPSGRTLQSVDAQRVTVRGDNIRPYCPVHVTATRDESGDLTISWVRRSRSRLGWGYTDAPILEENESYEVDIYDGSTVVRTLTASTNEVTYTLAQQDEDFVSGNETYTVSIYQLSSSIGRGFPKTAVVGSPFHYSVDTPEIISPASGGETLHYPVYIEGSHISLSGEGSATPQLEKAQWQFALDSVFSSVVHTEETEWGASGDIYIQTYWLPVNSALYARVRYKDINYGWSEWSAPVAFNTITEIVQSERDALLAFYEALGGDFTKEEYQYWGSDYPVSLWGGLNTGEWFESGGYTYYKLIRVSVSSAGCTGGDVGTTLHPIDFTNCDGFIIDNCGLTGIDISNLSDCVFDRSGLNLQRNNLTTIDFTGLTSIAFVIISDNMLTSAGISGMGDLTSVTYADFSNNLLSSIDFTGMPQLETIYCSNNQLTSINLSALANIELLDCSYNALSSIDLSSLGGMLNYLRVNNNQLTSIDLSGLTALESLDCSYNLLSSLDPSPSSVMRSLYCHHNNITNAILFVLSSPYRVHCQDNDLDQQAVDDTICGLLNRWGSQYNSLGELFIENNTAPSTTGEECAYLLAHQHGFTVTTD